MLKGHARPLILFSNAYNSLTTSLAFLNSSLPTFQQRCYLYTQWDLHPNNVSMSVVITTLYQLYSRQALMSPGAQACRFSSLVTRSPNPWLHTYAWCYIALQQVCNNLRQAMAIEALVQKQALSWPGQECINTSFLKQGFGALSLATVPNRKGQLPYASAVRTGTHSSTIDLHKCDPVTQRLVQYLVSLFASPTAWSVAAADSAVNLLLRQPHTDGAVRPGHGLWNGALPTRLDGSVNLEGARQGAHPSIRITIVANASSTDTIQDTGEASLVQRCSA